MDRATAETYAGWFRCLADATRLQLLHVLAGADGGLRVGELVDRVEVGQSTVSDHLRRLADEGFVLTEPDGTATIVRVNPECLRDLPAAAETIMGRPVAFATAGDRSREAGR